MLMSSYYPPGTYCADPRAPWNFLERCNRGDCDNVVDTDEWECGRCDTPDDGDDVFPDHLEVSADEVFDARD